LRVIDLHDMRGLPNAQLVNAPKPYAVTAAQIGQVFGVALDNATPPNIYAAASSAYGLPIVRAGGDGPLHVRRGSAQTSFMPGLWGASAVGGGPGSIWKIDGVSGAVTLFANVVLDGAPNSGPALGGLAFDPVSDSLLVTDRETGMIHSFAMNGAERARYDHGVQGRTAQGLPPVQFDPKRLDVTNPQFDSENPATWSYAPPERRIFGLGVRAGRLYYAVAEGLQIWSVSLNPDGSFGSDATLELGVPPAAGATEISKILFDDQGRMFLAERPDPAGAFDFIALTQEGIGRVLRYVLVDSQPGAARIWQAPPDEYAIGFPLEFRNDNGGVAIGYGYDAAGALDRGTCGGFLWSTGERLRETTDGDLAAHLSESGPPNVDGLQGNRIGLIRPMNVPPLSTYFIDYDDRFDEDGGAARGYLGDIAIWRVCGPALRGGWMLPGWMVWSWLRPSGWTPPPPSENCPTDQNKPGYRCCPAGTSPDTGGQCQPWCPNGATDPASQQVCSLGFDPTTYDPNDPSKLRCIGGAQPNAAKGILGCVDKSPVLNAPVCPAGWSKQNIPNLGDVCAPTLQQLQCSPGQQVSSIDGHCHNLCLGIAWPSSQCCAAGSVLSVSGRCCPPGSDPDPNTGTCRRPPELCPATQMTPGGLCCPDGSTPNTISGGCCPPGQSPAPGSGQCMPVSCPPPGKMIGTKCCAPADLQPGGACATCPPGQSSVGPSNSCCDRSLIYTNRSGAQACCRGGKLANGECRLTTSHGVPVLPQCTPGSTDPKCCADGYQPVGNGCCLASQVTSHGICCPTGQAPDGPDKSECRPIRIGWHPPSHDGGGDRHDGGQCCMTGLIPTANGSCCAPDQVTATGLCCPAGQVPGPNRQSCVPTRQRCSAGYTQMPDGSCCINRLVSEDGTTCNVRRERVPTPTNPADECARKGSVWDNRSETCLPPMSPADECEQKGWIWNGDQCLPPANPADECKKKGWVWNNKRKTCLPPPNPADECRTKGWVWNGESCVPPLNPAVECRQKGWVWNNKRKTCLPPISPADQCIEKGWVWTGSSCLAPTSPAQQCRKKGWIWNGRTCLPQTDPADACKKRGWVWDGKHCRPPLTRIPRLNVPSLTPQQGTSPTLTVPRSMIPHTAPPR
jgi:hypothetical protein